MSPTPDNLASRGILLDSFSRIEEQVRHISASITPEQLAFRPDSQANTIAWQIWHLGRGQDAQIADIAGRPQVWKAGGWVERFGLPFDEDATGYGQSPDEAGQVDVRADLLGGYHAEVHAMTVEYLREVDTLELARIVDDGWDPPVTAAVRLVSVIGDCMQHLGQAAYIRGLAERAAHRAT
ncbi:MAG TPA: DinB family protein [Acidimicrobiales bacterium]|jgi:hypothetical protein|nr:DinB family protein [Acidimicrobiales bacterium]